VAHHVAHLVPARHDEVAERFRVIHRAAQVADRGEEQVRLAFGHRELVDEVEKWRVVGDRAGEPFVGR
jgi:hypothetical protein